MIHWESLYYRILNTHTNKFPYPLPLVPASLVQLRKATVFTKFDLRRPFNLIRVKPGDEWKTAFITPPGHYEYLVMPFALWTTIFQSFMNEIFRNMFDQFVIVYIEDILIYIPRTYQTTSPENYNVYGKTTSS